MTVRGVLLDSGGVLVGPRGGRWNPRFDFEDVLLRHHADAPAARFEQAFAAGNAFLAARPPPVARDDYHRVVLGEIGIAEPSAELLTDLDVPLDVPVFDVFPEVVATLTEIQGRGLRMAMVTDNWGTSETVRALHDQVDTGGFFEMIVVSEELGARKPDPRMYRTASDGLGLAPEECVFVDDDPALVTAAIDLGYQGAALCRDPRVTAPDGITTIRTLDELLALL